jgi:hypothetical protein
VRGELRIVPLGVFGRGVPERTGAMRGMSLGAVYVVIGVIVAAINDYFDHLGSLERVGEAAIAVLIWPLILFGVDVNLS